MARSLNVFYHPDEQFFLETQHRLLSNGNLWWEVALKHQQSCCIYWGFKSNVVKEGEIVDDFMIHDSNFLQLVWLLSGMVMVKKGNLNSFFHFLYPKAFYGIISPSRSCSPQSYWIWELLFACNLSPYYFPWEIWEMLGGMSESG